MRKTNRKIYKKINKKYFSRCFRIGYMTVLTWKRLQQLVPYRKTAILTEFGDPPLEPALILSEVYLLEVFI